MTRHRMRIRLRLESPLSSESQKPGGQSVGLHLVHTGQPGTAAPTTTTLLPSLYARQNPESNPIGLAETPVPQVIEIPHFFVRHFNDQLLLLVIESLGIFIAFHLGEKKGSELFSLVNSSDPFFP